MTLVCNDSSRVPVEMEVEVPIGRRLFSFSCLDEHNTACLHSAMMKGDFHVVELGCIIKHLAACSTVNCYVIITWRNH